MREAVALTRAIPRSRLGTAWLALCGVFALHILDESLTGFLGVYNATVIALRQEAPWLIVPTLGFKEYLIALLAITLIAFALAPGFFKQLPWTRPLGYLFAWVNVLNALGHIVGTILGRTVHSVTFPRPAPGFYSSPLLFLASVWLLVELKRNRRSAPAPVVATHRAKI
jgi:hypothetical protein